MGRNPIPEFMKKKKISIAIPKYLLEWLKTKGNSSEYIHKLLLLEYQKEEKDRKL